MHKMVSNLMMVNKLIISCDSLIEEDIDAKQFSEKINFDINFINNKLDDFWIEYIKFIDFYEKEDFLKTYTYLLKRFYKFLNKIKVNTTLLDDYNINEIDINIIIGNLKNRINLIEKQKYRITAANTEKQYINEEEYNILLQNFEDE